MKKKRSNRASDLTAQTCKRILNEQIELLKTNPSAIRNNKGENFVMQDDEIITQCYSATDKKRKKFPKTLFITTHNRMLSVIGSHRVKWLTPSGDSSKGRPGYRIKNKNIPYYDIYGIVYDAEAFGYAAEVLEKKGFDAISCNGKLSVSGHHIDGFKRSDLSSFKKYEDKIQFVTNWIHELFNSMPSTLDGDKEKEIEFMTKFSYRASIEEPNLATIAIKTERHGSWSNTSHEIHATSQREVEKLLGDKLDLMRNGIAQAMVTGNTVVDVICSGDDNLNSGDIKKTINSIISTHDETRASEEEKDPFKNKG